MGASSLRLGVLLLGVASAAACVGFDVFTCSDAADCVLNGLPGACEDTGYCSFPDPECSTGSRYSRHAPSGLAGACVSPEGDSGSGSAEATGGSSTGGAETGGSTSDASESSGGITQCEDGDGDGAGIGPDCPAIDCDDDNPATTDGCFYLGPEGDDANPGTREAPWRTFTHAMPQLSPGASLVVLDGTYVESEVGTPVADCEEGVAVSGTEALPIFLRAENDLQVVIDREGRAYGAGTLHCDHWRFRGLSIVGRDNAKDDTGNWRAIVVVEGAEDIVVRHVFGHHTNRFYNEHGFLLGGSTNVLLEDVEVHDFFRSGFSVYGCDDVTCRRCYAHSHGAADLDACPELAECPDPDDLSIRGTTPCPMCSAGSPDKGDNSFYVEHSNDILLENCISEGSARGYQIVGGIGQDDMPAGRGIRVLESMSIRDDRGFVLSRNENGIATVGAVLQDVIVLDSESTAFELRHPDDLVLRNVSVFGSGGSAITVPAADTETCTDGACSATFERVLVEGSAGAGFRLEVEPETWSLLHSNISGNPAYDYPSFDADDPLDDSGNARDNLDESATRVGTGAGECRTHVPADSNMADPFGDGIPVGASVDTRFVDGVATDQRLWSADGAFPCIVDPLAPPQVPGEQCGDLAERVGFSASCEPPQASG